MRPFLSSGILARRRVVFVAALSAFALSAAVVLMFVAGLFGVGLFRTLQWYVEYRP